MQRQSVASHEGEPWYGGVASVAEPVTAAALQIEERYHAEGALESLDFAATVLGPGTLTQKAAQVAVGASIAGFGSALGELVCGIAASETVVGEASLPICGMAGSAAAGLTYRLVLWIGS